MASDDLVSGVPKHHIRYGHLAHGVAQGSLRPARAEGGGVRAHRPTGAIATGSRALFPSAGFHRVSGVPARKAPPDPDPCTGRTVKRGETRVRKCAAPVLGGGKSRSRRGPQLSFQTGLNYVP